jgi:hypothetical protein
MAWWKSHGRFLGALAFAAAHEGAWADQAGEGGGRFGQHAVVGAFDEVGVDRADFDVTVVHALDPQLVLLVELVRTHGDFDGDVVDVLLQRAGRGFRASSVLRSSFTPVMMAVSAARSITRVRRVMMTLDRLNWRTSSASASPMIGSAPSRGVSTAVFSATFIM